MQVKKLPSGNEMVDFLSSTGLTYWGIAREVGCHCSTILRIRDKPSVRPRCNVWEGLYKLYIKRASNLAPLIEKAEELGL